METDLWRHRSQYDDEMVARFTCRMGSVRAGTCHRHHAGVSLNHGNVTPRALLRSNLTTATLY